MGDTQSVYHLYYTVTTEVMMLCKITTLDAKALPFKYHTCIDTVIERHMDQSTEEKESFANFFLSKISESPTPPP